MKFCLGMDVDDNKVKLKGQSHRSKVKVTRSEKRDIWKSIPLRIMKFDQGMEVDDPKVDLKGQGQKSRSPGQNNVISRKAS